MLKEIGYNKDVKISTSSTKLATKAKLDAIVCSGQEIKIVNDIQRRDYNTWDLVQDMMTRKEYQLQKAYENGADWCV